MSEWIVGLLFAWKMWPKYELWSWRWKTVNFSSPFGDSDFINFFFISCNDSRSPYTTLSYTLNIISVNEIGVHGWMSKCIEETKPSWMWISPIASQITRYSPQTLLFNVLFSSHYSFWIFFFHPFLFFSSFSFRFFHSTLDSCSCLMSCACPTV